MEQVWVSVGTFIAGGGLIKLFDYFINKRKAKADTSGAEADTFNKELNNAVALVKFWRESTDTLRTEINMGIKAMEELTTERDRFRINLNIAKAAIAESTCKTLPTVKKKVAKL